MLPLFTSSLALCSCLLKPLFFLFSLIPHHLLTFHRHPPFLCLIFSSSPHCSFLYWFSCHLYSLLLFLSLRFLSCFLVFCCSSLVFSCFLFRSLSCFLLFTFFLTFLLFVFFLFPFHPLLYSLFFPSFHSHSTSLRHTISSSVALTSPLPFSYCSSYHSYSPLLLPRLFVFTHPSSVHSYSPLSFLLRLFVFTHPSAPPYLADFRFPDLLLFTFCNFCLSSFLFVYLPFFFDVIPPCFVLCSSLFLRFLCYSFQSIFCTYSDSFLLSSSLFVSLPFIFFVINLCSAC